ncbi:MAG TPA: pitrilysin family protein [Candidatus Krumholzibacteria bacterium]|nr:pitrilysin family protein [Candidatus Krumholzibacteria bacterium]HPD71326.1 pitrilysin family protein [Candidatus Krumholzibacteria bacterium]HRY38974.1 pitrilysin family protein [Candidatus Krumholzibacteria bacterium]
MNLLDNLGESPPRRTDVSGGAVLLEIPLPSAHGVCCGVWLRRGSASEAEGREGVAHFLEHIVFKGSERRTALEIAEAFDAIGAAIDAFTTKDYVAFTLKVLPEFLARAIDILSDMLLRPAFEPGLIALEQDVVCEEIQEVLDTPEDRLHDAYSAHVYQAHRRGRPILGTPETVRSLDERILRQEHRDFFAGPNVVLTLAGNLLPEHRDLMLAAFADLPAAGAGAAPAPGAPAPDPALRTASELVIKSPIVQTYFEIGNLGVSSDHPDRVPLLLLSNLLGGGMSSRVFQAVREREGLAYTVYTYTDMGPDTGLVSCAGCCTPEKEARVREVVAAEYRRFLSEGPTADELASNKAQFKSQLVFSLEGSSNQMYRAAKNEIVYRRFIPLAELVASVEAVDRETVMRCAAAWFDPDRLVHAAHRPSRRRR